MSKAAVLKGRSGVSTQPARTVRGGTILVSNELKDATEREISEKRAELDRLVEEIQSLKEDSESIKNAISEKEKRLEQMKHSFDALQEYARRFDV